MLDRICKLNVKGCVRRSSSSLLGAESRKGDGRTPEKLQMDMARWKHSKQTIFPRDMRPSLQIGSRKREILQKNHSAAASTVFLKLSMSLHVEAQRAAGEKFNHRKVQENRRREEGSRIALTSSARFRLLKLRTSESYRFASTCTLSERQQRRKT
jgi:hypothetical protein